MREVLLDEPGAVAGRLTGDSAALSDTVAGFCPATEDVLVNKERFDAMKELRTRGWTKAAIARH